MNMTNKDFFSLKDRSFSLYLLVAMVVLIVIVVGLVAVNDYNNSKNAKVHEGSHQSKR